MGSDILEYRAAKKRDALMRKSLKYRKLCRELNAVREKSSGLQKDLQFFIENYPWGSEEF